LLNSTAYVQPSRERSELQPIAVLEAMAAGVPVIASRVGAVAEMLGEGALGALVPPEDADALAAALAAVLTDLPGAEERARAAQARALEQCRPERLVDQVEAVYESL
jgi:glycosyltransferase involved in cell wall biosynthesis